METIPVWDEATDLKYEESLGILVEDRESLLPAFHIALREIAFLKDLEQRNLGYFFRSPEAEAELEEIRRELASWEDMAEHAY